MAVLSSSHRLLYLRRLDSRATGLRCTVLCPAASLSQGRTVPGAVLGRKGGPARGPALGSETVGSSEKGKPLTSKNTKRTFPSAFQIFCVRKSQRGPRHPQKPGSGPALRTAQAGGGVQRAAWSPRDPLESGTHGPAPRMRTEPLPRSVQSARRPPTPVISDPSKHRDSHGLFPK